MAIRCDWFECPAEATRFVERPLDTLAFCAFCAYHASLSIVSGLPYRVRVPADVLRLAWLLERNRNQRDGFHAGAS